MDVSGRGSDMSDTSSVDTKQTGNRVIGHCNSSVTLQIFGNVKRYSIQRGVIRLLCASADLNAGDHVPNELSQRLVRYCSVGLQDATLEGAVCCK